jgi:hypothetical protein
MVGREAAVAGSAEGVALIRAKVPDSRRRHHGVVLSAALSSYKHCVCPSPLLFIHHFAFLLTLPYTLSRLTSPDDDSQTALLRY